MDITLETGLRLSGLPPRKGHCRKYRRHQFAVGDGQTTDQKPASKEVTEVILPLFRVAPNLRITQPFYAVPRTRGSLILGSSSISL